MTPFWSLATVLVKSKEGDDAAASNEGKVINVYSFNDELRKRITAVYPEIVDTSDDKDYSILPNKPI